MLKSLHMRHQHVKKKKLSPYTYMSWETITTPTARSLLSLLIYHYNLCLWTEGKNGLQWTKFTVSNRKWSLHEEKIQFHGSNTWSPEIPISNSIFNHFCNTQCMWHSLEDLLDPWLRSVPTLPRKGKEMTELEKAVKELNHISPLSSVPVLDFRGRFAQVPVCITHGKDSVPHTDGNTVFMC